MRTAFLLALAGCYAPSPQPGAPCNAGRCPSGLVCSAATDTCERHDVDAGVHDAVDASGAEAQAMPAVVQLKGNQIANVVMLSVTLDALPAPGRLLVMTGGGPSAGLISVTGGGVPAWVRATGSLINANIEIWYGITDGTSGTVTLALPPMQPSEMTAVVSEWTKVSGTLDGFASNAGTTSPASTLAIATTGPALVIFAAASTKPNAFAAPSPGTWTELPFATSLISQKQWYRFESAPLVIAPEVVLTGTSWDAATAAFRTTP